MSREELKMEMGKSFEKMKSITKEIEALIKEPNEANINTATELQMTWVRLADYYSEMAKQYWGRLD